MVSHRLTGLGPDGRPLPRSQTWCQPPSALAQIPSLPPAVRCPAPASFENGIYVPRLGSYPVGGNLSFECEHGFTLRGSPVRSCRPNGLWDGETAVCDNGGKRPDCCGAWGWEELQSQRLLWGQSLVFLVTQ